MSVLKKFAGQTLIYGLSTVIARLINFVLTPVLTRAYATEVFGIFTNLYAYASILNAILAFGMETTFFRFLQKHSDRSDTVRNTSFFFILLMSGVFLLGTVLFAADISNWLFDERGPEYVDYIYIFVGILVMDALAVIPFAQIRADGKPLRFGLIKLTNVGTMVAFTLLFIVVLPYIATNNLAGADWVRGWLRDEWIGYVFLSNAIASFVTLLLLIPELSRLKIEYNKMLMKEMLLYSTPILIANLSFIINETLDKIFLIKLLPIDIGARDLGIYGAASKLAVFLSIFVNAFRLGAEPFFFSHSKNPDSVKTYAMIMDYFVIAVSLAVVGLVGNIEILKYFIPGGDADQQALYWSGLHIVPVLLMGYVFLGVYINLSIWYKLSDQTRFGLYISVIGAIFTIVLNILFIPQYSYVASAWITATVYLIMMILSFVLGQKNYPIPYHVLKNVAYILSAAMLCWLCFDVFERNLLAGNAIFAIFIIVTFFAERKRLSNLLSKST